MNVFSALLQDELLQIEYYKRDEIIFAPKHSVCLQELDQKCSKKLRSESSTKTFVILCWEVRSHLECCVLGFSPEELMLVK